MVFGAPSTMALTFLRFGFQVLFVLLWEWLTLIPKTMPFPQTAHFAIYRTPPVMFRNNIKNRANLTHFCIEPAIKITEFNKH